MTVGERFIGSHIVDLLVTDGHELVIVDDLSSGSEKNINEKALFYKMDIQDSELSALFKKNAPKMFFTTLSK